MFEMIAGSAFPLPNQRLSLLLGRRSLSQGRTLVMLQLCSRLCLLVLLYFSLGGSWELLVDALTVFRAL